MTLLLTTGLLAQAALAYDHTHAAWDAVLQGAVTDAGVDYDILAGRHKELKAYLEANANANVKTFDKNQQLAFYVNTYNALTVNVILNANQPASIQDVLGGKVWEQMSFPVGRETLTLNDIEHSKARPLTDGRIHAVVNCASKGCPPLPARAIQATTLEQQLDEGARNWVSTNAYSYNGKILELSQIFKWYAEDFTGMAKGTASEPEMQKAATTFITKYGAKIDPPPAKVEWQNYDWSLNKARK